MLYKINMKNKMLTSISELFQIVVYGNIQATEILICWIKAEISLLLIVLKLRVDVVKNSKLSKIYTH